MAKVILGIVGPIASGKGTLKKYLEEKYSAQDCRYSTMLRDVLSRLDISNSRENMQLVSTILRQNFGEDLMAKVIVKDAKKIDSDIVVIDGVRRLADIKYLAEMDNFYLVAIEADPKLRHERLLKRNENEGDKNKNYEQFLKDHEAEAECQVPIVMTKASFKLSNDGDLKAFYLQIDKIINQVLVK